MTNSNLNSPKDEQERFFPLKSEKTAVQFSQAIPVGTYIMSMNEDKGASFTFVSDRFLELLDLDRQKVLGNPEYVYSKVHPEDLPKLEAISQHSQKNLLPFSWEGRILVRGKFLWFLSEANIRKLDNGNFIYEGATTDVTKQKLAELALQEKHRQAIQLLESIPVPMAINSLEGERITFLNKSFTQLFGYSLSDIPTVTSWAKLAYPDEVYRNKVFAWWNAALENYINNNVPIPQQPFRIKTKAGNDLHVTILASLLNNELILTFIDVTESVKRQTTLAKSQEVAIKSALRKVENTEQKMLSSLISLALERDNETGNHIVRTQNYVKQIALRLRQMGHYVDELSDEMIEYLYKTAPLHDIGKVGIPDSILKKPGKLTDEEWAVMKTHPSIGERVLNASEIHDYVDNDILKVAILIAGGHHEKWDGSGYPRGLKGLAIPLPARIMAIADMYDALVSARVYKREWSHQDAIEEIVSKSGQHFDPNIVNAFLLESNEIKKIADQNSDD